MLYFLRRKLSTEDKWIESNFPAISLAFNSLKTGVLPENKINLKISIIGGSSEDPA